MFLKTIFKKMNNVIDLSDAYYEKRRISSARKRTCHRYRVTERPSMARDKIHCLTDAGYKFSVSADDQQTKIEPV